MKLNSNLKWMAVLAVVAGCATEPDEARISADCAGQTPSALPATETFAEAYGRHLAAVRKWSCHSFVDQVVKGVPDAMAFVRAHEADAGHASELSDLRYRIIETLVRGQDYTSGVAYAQAFYDDKKAHWTRRSLAASYLAMGIVDKKKDYAAADRLYAKLLDAELARMSSPLMIGALIRHRAYLYVLRDDKEGALKYVESERDRMPGNDGFKRALAAEIDAAGAKVYADFYDYRGELDYRLKRGNVLAAFDILNRSKVSDIPLMEKLSREIVLSDAYDPGARAQAWIWLSMRDQKFCEANVSRCLGKTAASTNAFLGKLVYRITGNNLSTAYGPPAPCYNRNPEGTVRLWKVYEPIAAQAKAPVDFGMAQYAAIAFVETGDRAKAADVLAKGLANEKLKPEERFMLQLLRKTLSFKGSEDEIAAQAKAAVDELGQGLTRKDLLKYLERAYSVVVLSGDKALEAGVAKYYLENVRQTPEKKVYTVRFSDRLIAGAGDWANLPFKPDESDFDRTYRGGSMAFMTTDVTTGDRSSAAGGGEKVRKHPTTMQAVADEWGLHFVYTYYDRRARQFESGELDAGSFESYLAPGEGAPYVCFLNYPKKNVRGTVMNTTYDMAGRRRVDDGDTNVFRSDVAFTDGSIVVHVGFAWDSFADRIPADGGTWEFESLFWGPVPSAWNGCESIHGRSTWGRLRFELGDAARVKILRSQLFAAVNGYKAEKLAKPVSRKSVQEGVFEHWSDDEVGDPEFYRACLVPLMAELDPVAAKVRVGMSDEDVRAIAERYLPRFRDIRFEVAHLRTAYLETSLMEQ